MELEAVLLSCVGSNNGICAGFGVHTSLKSSVLLLSYCSDPLADPARTDSSRGRSSKRIGKSPSNLSAQIECVEAQTLLELDVGDERFVSVSVCHSPGSSMNGAEPRIVIIGATQRSLHRWAFTYESASSTGLSLTEQISSSLFMISYEECEAAVRSVTLSSSGTFVAVVQGSKAVVYGEGLERELVADLSAASKAELRRVPHQNVSGSNYGRVVDVQFIEDEANPHLLTLHSSGIVMVSPSSLFLTLECSCVMLTIVESNLEK